LGKGINRRTKCEVCGATIKERLIAPENSTHYIRDCPGGRTLKFLDRRSEEPAKRLAERIRNDLISKPKGVPPLKIVWTAIAETTPTWLTVRQLARMPNQF
jgi:hypothetical protein